MRQGEGRGHAPTVSSHRFAVAVGICTAPLVILILATLWRAPYPISEVVALFEDVDTRQASSYLWPTSAYYRPLSHMTVWSLWHGAESTATALAAIRLLLIVPVVALVGLLITAMRPRTATDAAAATVAVAVLLGSPGLLDNLELGLSYTIVSMPAALGAWVIAEQRLRPWHDVVLIALLALAVGFKEQGLVLVPVLLVAWVMGAPGVSRRLVHILIAFAVAYILFRLATRPAGARVFEQDVGLWFETIQKEAANARFGTFPLPIYAYNAASTIGRLLVAEPTSGVFAMTLAVTRGQLAPWQLVQVASATGLTALIAWWGATSIRRSATHPWTPEARAFAAFVVAVVASGALSFNYSRDRLGGMAVPFQALAGYLALRALLQRAPVRTPMLVMASVIAVSLATTWQLRAIATLESLRFRAVKDHREWLTDVPNRRRRFAGRDTYLQVLSAMAPQGTRPTEIQPTRYPVWMRDLLGEF